MAGNLPIQQDILNLGAAANVVKDHVLPTGRRFPGHNYSDVRNITAQVPGDDIAWSVIARATRGGERFSLASEKDH